MNLPAQNHPKRRRRAPLILIVLLLGALALFLGLRVGPPPTVAIDLDQPGVGKRPLAVTVRAAEPKRGLSRLVLEAVQDERVIQVGERAHQPAAAWAFWQPRVAGDTWTVSVGRDNVTGLEAGELTLRVTAQRAGTWLRRGAPVVVEQTVPVHFQPPLVSVHSTPNRAAQGGSGLVVYRVGDRALEAGGSDGVEAGDRFFPGHPVPNGQPGLRFALFGVPFDLDDPKRLRLVAVDALGNRAEASFIDGFKTRPPASDTIQLSDGFFAKVVPEILGQTPSLEPKATPLDSYLAINGDLRRENAGTLDQMAIESRAEMFWAGAFQQLPGSQVTSNFADRRTYMYDGREVDHQDHLGYDLASVRRAPVPAANGGLVVLARYFGIYGNTVVVDHGYGLMTLYSHLSSIDVEKGQVVPKGTTLGRTGETGLAGGDHLHFTTLIGGVAVDPLEWFDARWITNHITDKLTAAVAPPAGS